MSSRHTYSFNENAAMPGLVDDFSEFFDFDAAALDEATEGADNHFAVPPAEVPAEREVELTGATRASASQLHGDIYLPTFQLLNGTVAENETADAFGPGDVDNSLHGSASAVVDTPRIPATYNTESQRFFEQPPSELTPTSIISPIDTALIHASQPPKPRSMPDWSPGCKCPWPNCTSKCNFIKEVAFKEHVTNKHINPLLCKVPGCTHQDSFGRTSDLRRHEISVHSSPGKYAFKCEVPSCDSKIKEFARKDHLEKHIRERHDRYFCPWNHCPRGVKDYYLEPAQLADHIESEHGQYECAIKACDGAAISKFTKHGLDLHLKSHHDVLLFLRRDVFRGLDSNAPTIGTADIPCWGIRKDCKLCTKKQPAQEGHA